MKAFLVSTKRGGHRSTPTWTKHIASGRFSVCGLAGVKGSLPADRIGTQGVVKECGLCRKLTTGAPNPQ